MTGHRWLGRPPTHELGAIVHGPVVLARAPDIVVGLRCVHAHPTGLHLPLVVRAQGRRIRDASAWSYGKLRRYRPGSFDERENGDQGFVPYSAPQLVVEVNDISGDADTTGAVHAGDDEVWGRDAACWIDDLPHDGRLVLTTSWPQAGLPATRTELALDGLGELAGRVLPLL